MEGGIAFIRGVVVEEEEENVSTGEPKEQHRLMHSHSYIFRT